MRRFGPSPVFYVAVLAAVGLVLAFFATGTEYVPLLVAGVVVFLATLPGWNWYGLDREGIHRRGIEGSKFVPWEHVDTVLGRRVESVKRPTTVLTQFVVDARNRPLLRLGPWIFHRRRMVRLILATVSARRKEEAPRDE